MEMPDEIYAAEYFDIDDVSLKEWREKSITGSEKYHHHRVVEALRRENEELKAKHCDAMRLLDKAKWQPIESAPYGTECLLLSETKHIEVGQPRRFCDAGIKACYTHWMPLPDAPEQH